MSKKPPDPTWSLERAFPELAAQWHRTRNNLSPRQVVWGSGKRVWWQCRAGADHEWATKIQHRTQAGSRCPYCTGRKLSRTNSLLAVAPHLAAEVDPAYGKAASEIIAGSHERVQWRCPEGPDHVWRAAVKDRVSRGSGCPFCSRRLLSVTNSLAALHPDLAREFAEDLNGFGASEVIAGTNTRLWWRCPVAADHVWRTSANNRIVNRTGCPHCAGQRPSETNSLELYPDIAAELHPSKNRLRARDIPSGTTRKVWWRCRLDPDHVWQASVVNRTRGRGCPSCSPRFHSKKEIGLAAELALFFRCDLADHKVTTEVGQVDVDIILRQHRLVIEYDGHHWHRSRRTADRRKTLALERAGWRVIRVRERPLEKLGSDDLLISRNATVKQLANAVLEHLATVAKLKPAGLRRYLSHPRCLNGQQADQRVAQLKK